MNVVLLVIRRDQWTAQEIPFLTYHICVLGVVMRGWRGHSSPGAENPNIVTSTSFNTVHWLPKAIRFEHAGTKLASCPWRHQASLRPWVWWIFQQIISRPCTQSQVTDGNNYRLWLCSRLFEESPAWFCSHLAMIQACTYHSAIIVKPQQWPTPSESIAIYCVRKLASCVLHIFSSARKSTNETKRKNYALLLFLRSKLKITKIEHNYNPSTKHSYITVQRTRSQRPFGTSDWQKILSAFSVVSVSDDHVVYNRP